LAAIQKFRKSILEGGDIKSEANDLREKGVRGGKKLFLEDYSWEELGDRSESSMLCWDGVLQDESSRRTDKKPLHGPLNRRAELEKGIGPNTV